MIKTYEMTNYLYGKLIGTAILKEWIISEEIIRKSVKRIKVDIPEWKRIGDPSAESIHLWIVRKGVKVIH